MGIPSPIAQHPPSGDKILVKLMKRVFTLIVLAFAVPACRLAAAPNKLAAPPNKKTKTTSPPAAAKTTHKPAATPASSRNTVGHTASRTSSGTATKMRTGSTAKVKYVRGRRGKGGRLTARTAPAPSYQLHPEPERYQQIQQAL